MSEKDGMRIGKITQTAWQRTVRKQLHTEDKRTLFGASPWETCSGFETEGGGGYVWADACASGDDGRTGYHAVYHASGELAARGVSVEGAAVRILLPTGSSEEKLGLLAAGVDLACRELNIQASSFQAEVSGAVRQTVVFVSAAGKLYSRPAGRKRGQEKHGAAQTVQKGEMHREIVQCGYAGLKGHCASSVKPVRSWRQGLSLRSSIRQKR